MIIPVSWYNIDENSKNIYIRRFRDLTGIITTDKIVPIEIGNHTADSLKDALQNALHTVFGDSEFGGNVLL